MSAKTATIFESHFHCAKVVCPSFFCAICQVTFYAKAFDTRILTGKKSEDTFIKKLEEAVKEAKKNREWRHEYMTLLMRDQENLEKGMEKGMEKGKIIGMVIAYRELNISEDMIMKKIQEKFMLSTEEAKEYLKEEE